MEPVPLTELRPGHRVRVWNQQREHQLVQRLELALSPWSRLRGLLGHPPLQPGEGLLLLPCRAIHTFFMSFAIDAAFLDEQGQVVELCQQLVPWRASSIHGLALATLELAPGSLEHSGTRRGDRLLMLPLAD